MKTMVLIACSLFMIQSHAQIGKGRLGGLKDKVKDKGSSSGSASTPAVTPYSKHMKAGEKAEKEEDYVTAYKEYAAALEAKSGDYSAKSAKGRVESNMKSDFFAKMEIAQKEGRCDEMEKLADESLAILGSWNQADYFKKEVPKCQKNAGAAQAKAANAEALAKLEKGKGHFSSDFTFNGPKQSLNVEDDMVVRFMFDKTMIEYAEDFGVSPDHYAYSVTNVYVNGEKIMTKYNSFASNISKVWDYIDIPVILDPSFIKKIQSDKSLLQTPQDIWMMQESMNPEMGAYEYVEGVFPHASKGDFTITVEFGLGEKGEAEPKGIVAKSDVKVNVTEAGLAKLGEKGPKYLRPLLESEKAKCTAYGSKFGSENIGITIDLPHPPKYYNQKWCQEGIPATCDYDAGSFRILVYLDGEPFEYVDEDVRGNAYTTESKLSFVVLPKTDGEMFATAADVDRIDGASRLNYSGDYISNIIDQINGGKIKPGKHTVKIKVYAEEVIPKKDLESDRYENSTWYEFLSPYQHIAEGECSFTIDQNGIAKFQSKTYLDVPEKKVAKWATTEQQLKSELSNPDITVKAVNIRWKDWEVTYNALKQPIYRETTADIYYFNKKTNSHRYLYSRKVKADYSGGWGKAYWNQNIMGDMLTESKTLDPGTNYPVPGNLKF